MKHALLIFSCIFLSELGFSQTLSELFSVDTLIDLGRHLVDTRTDLIIKAKDGQVGLLFKQESDDTHATFVFYDLQTKGGWKEELTYAPNFQFFVPSHQIRDFDFDREHIVVRYADLTNYLCVFNRQSGVLMAILPSFEDFAQFKLIGDHIYFGKHYNTHPKKSPYKTIVGKINWRTKVLENFELPDFELVEFSHFEPNDWYDVNNLGQTVFSQTINYEFSIYNENLGLVDKEVMEVPSWKAVDAKMIIETLDSLGDQPTARTVIETLIPWHNQINRIQTIDFLNDSTLIVSKIVEHQSEQERLRTFDVIRINTKDTVVKSKILVHDIPDELLAEKEVLTKENYEYRIRQKPHVFWEDTLLFVECRYSPMTFGTKKKKLKEQNNKAALTNEKKIVYLVVAPVDHTLLRQDR